MNKLYIITLFVLLVPAASAANEITTVDIQYTDTIQERVNVTEYDTRTVTSENGTETTETVVSGWHYETGGNTYIYKVSRYWYDGDEITVELAHNTLTLILQSKQPYKDCKNDGKYPGLGDCFNDHGYYNGSDIDNATAGDLSAELDNVPVYHNGGLVKTTAIKDAAKNVTVKGVSPGDRIKIGRKSLVIDIQTQQNWNTGTFNGTTADSPDHLGQLGIGYRNGTAGTCFRFDGTSGADYCGTEDSFTVSGNPTENTDALWSTDGWAFDGVDDRLDVDDLNLNSQRDWSVIIWAKPTLDGDNHNLFGRYNSPNILQIQIHGTNNVRARVGHYLEKMLITEDVITTNEWHMYTMTFDASANELTFSQDAGTRKTDSGAVGDFDTTNGPSIGGRNDNKEYSNSVIDNVWIFDKELSEQEVEKWYRWGSDGTFNGDFNSSSQSYTGTPSELEVNQSNIDSSGNETWVRVSTDNGEEQVVALNTSSGVFNYTLDSFSTTGGNVWAWVNMTADTAVLTPTLESMRIFTETVLTNESRPYVFDEITARKVQDQTPETVWKWAVMLILVAVFFTAVVYGGMKAVT